MERDEHLEETDPAKAQFRALRVAASVLLQLASDVKDPAQPEVREIMGTEKLSDLEVDLISYAVASLAQELDLRAEQVYQANVRYLDQFVRRN